MASKKGLGKGLDSLISTNYAKKAANPTKSSDISTVSSTKEDKNVEKGFQIPSNALADAISVKITDVERNKEQPRRQFDETALEELAESIRQFGVLQPLLVKKVDRHYVIIAGERRWRAAKLAGCKEVPVLVRDYSDREIMEISLIENIQREDLNVIEEAVAYRKLLDEFGYRQEDLAARISRSRSAITNRLRLLKLAPEIQEMLKDGSLSEGHARALLSLELPEDQVAAAGRILEEGLSVRETERLVKKLQNPPAEMLREDWKREDQIVYDQLEEDLRAAIGSKVAIKRLEKDKGRIVIDYYSTDELERITDLFKHPGIRR